MNTIEKDESPTSSVRGCQHWYNTLLSEQARIGEYLEKHGTADENLLRQWGKSLRKNSARI